MKFILKYHNENGITYELSENESFAKTYAKQLVDAGRTHSGVEIFALQQTITAENDPHVGNYYICEKCDFLKEFKDSGVKTCLVCNSDRLRKYRKSEVIGMLAKINEMLQMLAKG